MAPPTPPGPKGSNGNGFRWVPGLLSKRRPSGRRFPFGPRRAGAGALRRPRPPCRAAGLPRLRSGQSRRLPPPRPPASPHDRHAAPRDPAPRHARILTKTALPRRRPGASPLLRTMPRGPRRASPLAPGARVPRWRTGPHHASRPGPVRARATGFAANGPAESLPGPVRLRATAGPGRSRSSGAGRRASARCCKKSRRPGLPALPASLPGTLHNPIPFAMKYDLDEYESKSHSPCLHTKINLV